MQCAREGGIQLQVLPEVKELLTDLSWGLRVKNLGHGSGRDPKLVSPVHRDQIWVFAQQRASSFSSMFEQTFELVRVDLGPAE